MPSRKRNKGKERKAKKAEAVWRIWAVGGGEERCNHGCVIPPRDHAISRFMNTFYGGNIGGDDSDEFDALAKTFEMHPEVWNDAEQRQMVIGILLSMGTNMLLRLHGGIDLQTLRLFGLLILILDYYVAATTSLMRCVALS